MLASVYPSGMTEAQWAVGSSLKRSGGTWSTYVSRLRAAGRVEKRGELWFATDQGFADIGDAPPVMPPPGPELVEFWCQRISGAGPMLRYLVSVWPESVRHVRDLPLAAPHARPGRDDRRQSPRRRSPIPGVARPSRRMTR